jgi:hypothetical protein
MAKNYSSDIEPVFGVKCLSNSPHDLPNFLRVRFLELAYVGPIFSLNNLVLVCG